jgi:hypothetical protein
MPTCFRRLRFNTRYLCVENLQSGLRSILHYSYLTLNLKYAVVKFNVLKLFPAELSIHVAGKEPT